MALVPPFIETLAPYVPGKPIEETEREYGVANVVKLASNENPLGPSPKAAAALRDAVGKLHLYPDGASYYLRRALAAKLAVPEAEVMVGAGSNELIELLIRTFVHGDEELLLARGSFIMYRLAAQAVGRKVVEVPLTEAKRYDLPAMAKAVGPKTRLVFVANPDNPTGTYVTKDELVAFLEAVYGADTTRGPIVVLDEAYFEYVDAADYPDALTLRGRFPLLVSLRTFSKIHGLAGLRLGYGVAKRELVDYVNRTRMPFNVSVPAQIAGVAALEDEDHVRRTHALNRQGLAELAAELPKLGLSVTPSQTNFFLVDFHRPAGPLFEPLLRAGVIVRPMGGYGFGTCARINTGTAADHQRLFDALRKVLA